MALNKFVQIYVIMQESQIWFWSLILLLESTWTC